MEEIDLQLNCHV